MGAALAPGRWLSGLLALGVATVLLMALGPALAQAGGAGSSPVDDLTAADKDRFARIGESRARALAAAQAGDPPTYRLARQIVDAPALPIADQDIIGTWRCRTFALGGTLGPKFAASKTGCFRCRILPEGNGFTLRKLSGSMAWLGRVRRLSTGRMLYYGTAIAQGDRIPIYPEESRFSSRQVGILQKIGPNRLRIEMPEPKHRASSFHDVVELVR